MHSPRLQVAVHSSGKNQQPVRDAQPLATSCRALFLQEPTATMNTPGTWLNSSFKSQHGSPRQTQTIVELRGTWLNSSTSRKAALLEGTCVPQSRRKALNPTRAQVAMLFVQMQGTWPNLGTSCNMPALNWVKTRKDRKKGSKVCQCCYVHQ